MRTSTCSFLAAVLLAAAACNVHVNGGGGAGGHGITSGATSMGTGAGGDGGTGSVSSSGSTGGAGGAGTGGGGGGGIGGGDLVWLETFPGCATLGSVRGLGTDAAGRIAFGGIVGIPANPLQCTIDFGGGVSVSTQMLHPVRGYAAEIDPSGKALWADVLTGISEEVEAGQVDDVHGSGKLVASTWATQSITADTFNRLKVLDPTGAVVWEKFFDGNSGGGPWIDGAWIDGSGGALVQFICGPGSCYYGGPNKAQGVYLAKFDKAGTFLWDKQLQNPQSVSYWAFGAHTGDVIAYNPAGWDFGCGPAGAQLAKLDPSGNCVWAKQSQSPGKYFGLSADDGGGVLVTSIFTGVVDLGCGPLASPSGNSLAITRLDPSGNCVFNKAFTGPGFTVQASSSVRPTAGGWILAMSFTGTIDLGGGPIDSPDPNAPELLVVKLDDAGALRWSHLWKTPSSYPFYTDITGDPSGGMVLVSTDTTLDLGNGPVLNGNMGIILAKFGP